jgi:alpha-2-macroglobulin
VLKKYKKLNAYSQALFAMVLEGQGKHDEALGVIRNLETFAVKSATSARWQAPDNEYGWMDNTVETTAYVLKAMLRVEPDNKMIPLIVRYLATSRNGDHWYSTKDTAAAVIALTDYMMKKESSNPNVTFTVKLNGKQIFNRKFTKADVFLPAPTVEITDENGGLPSGDNTIEITRSGEGKLYYTASLTWFASQKNIKNENNGIKVSRFYSYDEAGKKKIKFGASMKSGQDIYVHLYVRPGGTREYAIIEDMLPSGFEVVKEDYDQPYYYGYWSWWYPRKEIHDDKVAFFATSMYEKDYDITYRIRSEVPGTVAALPARAWLMYFPEVGGNSDEFLFNVKE